MVLLHSTRLALPAAALALTSAVGAQAPPPSTAAASSFTVFFRSVRIGSEEIAVGRSADGWTITSTGRIGAPIDVVTRRLQIRYDPDWKPLELTIDATSRGQALSVHTTVSGTTATSALTRAGQAAEKSDTIAADAVLLRNPFFAAYEAVAARLKTAAIGSTIPAYGVPQISVTIRVGDFIHRADSNQRATRRSAAHAHYAGAGGHCPTDRSRYLDRRELAALASERSGAEPRSGAGGHRLGHCATCVIVSRAGDEYGRIPANGFTLVGTLSKPTGRAANPRRPSCWSAERDQPIATGRSPASRCWGSWPMRLPMPGFSSSATTSAASAKAAAGRKRRPSPTSPTTSAPS